jgi:hypothetical protein
MDVADFLSDNAKWALGLVIALLGVLAAHRLALWRDRIRGKASPERDPDPRGNPPEKPQRPNRTAKVAIPLTPLSYSLCFDVGRPGGPLLLADGTTARMDLQVVCRITNPYKSVFGTTEAHFMDALVPIIYSRVHQLLEHHSFASARVSRKDNERLLQTELSPEFAKAGVTIEGIYIGPLEPSAEFATRGKAGA